MSSDSLTAAEVLDGLADAIVVADGSGQILYVNERTCRLVRRGAADLIGAEIAVLMPERLRAAHRAGFARLVTGGPPRILGVPTRVPVLDSEGVEHDAELLISKIGEGERFYLIGTLRDIAGEVALERELEASRFLAASVEVTDRLHRARTLDEGLSAVLPTLCAGLDWELATMWVFDAEGELLQCVDVWHRSPVGKAVPLERASLRRSFRIGEGLPGRVLEDGMPIVVPDLTAETNFPRRDDALAAGFRCAAALPLVSGKEVLGVIELFNTAPVTVSDEMLQMMESVGRQIGQFIDRLRGEEQLRELAETLQASLLPPRAPDNPGMRVAAVYRSGVAGLSVGGDIYDVFPAGSGRWALLIGDVCGKGAAAASATAVARYAARAAAIDHPDDPAAVLATINEALMRDTTERPFLTAAFALISARATGAMMTVAVAGHPLPYLIDRGGHVSEIGIPGQLLGVFDQIDATSLDVELGPDETAVFFTDGLFEARSETGEQFGDERLRTMLATHAREPVDALVHELARAATRFAGGAPQDDMAIVALRPGR